MSVSYTAHTYLGVAISWDDLFLVTEQDVVQCNHPEAVGKKFCPECGLPENERVVHTKKVSWKPVVRTLATGDLPELEEEELDCVSFLCAEDIKIGSFEILDVASTDKAPAPILGIDIGSAEDEDAFSASKFPTVQKQATALQGIADQLGVKKPLKVYTVLYCFY